jgi:hypothetical protein
VTFTFDTGMLIALERRKRSAWEAPEFMHAPLPFEGPSSCDSRDPQNQARLRRTRQSRASTTYTQRESSPCLPMSGGWYPSSNSGLVVD